jgi:triacylglycerol lipase
MKYKYIFLLMLLFSLFSSCSSAKFGQPTNDEDADEQITLKYPLVLVHGVALYDKMNYLEIWGRIPQTLTDRGVQVFHGNTEGWRDYESNALILKETIEKILLETGKEKVNIIAHSKGGLDARYLLWKYDIGDKVASLTTISTPHHGTEVADLIYNQRLVDKEMIIKALDLLGEIDSNINPIVYEITRQLTTEYMKEFNEKVIMDNRVYFQNLYTTMKRASDDELFRYTYQYIKGISGANDGLVSEVSARWGDNSTKIRDGISHREIIDILEKISPVKNIPIIYVGIVKGLRDKGF